MSSVAPDAASAAPLPPVPWQFTGNHWFAVPCIAPNDGAIHAISLLHRGARAAIEFAGNERFLDGTGAALARPVIAIDGETVELARGGVAWERALNWLPTFTSQARDVVVRGTIIAPFGQDADIAGAVYALSFENRTDRERTIAVALEGTLGHRQLRVRTPRPMGDEHRVREAAKGVVLLDGTSSPGFAALAIAADTADGDATVELGHVAGAPTYAIRRTLTIPAKGRGEVAFFIAAGPERDGAEATVGVMRRRGWRELVEATRESLGLLEQSTGTESLDALVNRNLFFAYFYAVGRALDDAQFYLVRSRAPWCAWGTTIRDWEALAWTIPAVQVMDAPLARELILRACEVHGYSPGRGVNYLDGTLFEPGFTLEGVAAYPLATERYIAETGDDQIVEELILADTLYACSDELAARREEAYPLYTTEVRLDGAPAPYPFTLHGNAVAAFALDALKKTLDEEAAEEVQDPRAVRNAIRQHFASGGVAKGTYASATDLEGQFSHEDDPVGSALWLPVWEAVDRRDAMYKRTVKRVERGNRLIVALGQLVGPDAREVLEWLRRAPLHEGVAAEYVDADGRAMSHGGDAAMSGLLAYTVMWVAATLPDE